MDTNEIKPLLVRLNLNTPASPQAITSCETALGIALSEQYKTFLNLSNGAEGFVGDSYLILWCAEQLAELNNAYHVTEYAPGLVLFGSSGGGEAYAFDARYPDLPIVQVPFVGMDLREVCQVAPTFLGFMKKLAEAPQDG